VGLGSTTLVSPAVLLLAVASTPVWGAPGLVVGPLLLLAAPLAGLTAHRLGRRLTDRRRPRIVWAAGYGLTVVASGAVSQGRLGTVVALVVLPIVVGTTLQLVDAVTGDADGATPRRTALRWGIWVAVAASFAPIVLVLALLGLVVVAGVERRVRRPALVGVAVAVVLLSPWVLPRLLHPGLWWSETGATLAGAEPGWRTALGLLAGRAGSPEQAPLWLGAGLLLLALVALVPRSTRLVVGLCWLLAVLSLVVAVVGLAVPWTLPGSPVQVRPWVGVPAGAVALSLGAAALLGVPELLRGRRRALVNGVLVLALVLPVGTAVWWTVRGAAGPLEHGTPRTVPAFLTERPGDTLVVRGSVARGVQVEVVRGAGPLVGEEQLRPSPSASTRLADAVEGLLATPGRPQVEALAGLGVGAVYAPDVDPDVARALDAAPALQPSGSDAPTSRVWTLQDTPQVVDPDGPAWRPPLAAVQVVLWILAVVLTAPVRRRRTDADIPAEEVRA
jgi:hypothetical protein